MMVACGSCGTGLFMAFSGKQLYCPDPACRRIYTEFCESCHAPLARNADERLARCPNPDCTEPTVRLILDADFV